ncbi:MAG: hypothetical protein ISR65_03730 [Bacteriovoracaceae bacterium]|nr:hypothetical protein [Bacteriovoracaceae bacterium]
MKELITKKILLLTLVLMGCSGPKTLNLKEHEFDALPTDIVWIQVAGLAEEHLALLRFKMATTIKPVSFERAACVGKMWNYNLKDLRPDPYSGFMSQISGRLNFSNTCPDFQTKVLWNYIEDLGHISGLFEVGAKDNSLDKAWECGADAKNFTNDFVLWKMGAKADKAQKTYHFHEEADYQQGEKYYDKSCQQQGCYASVTSNVHSLYKRFKKNKIKTLFIMRDYKYYELLSSRKILKAQEYLVQLDSIFSTFLDLAQTKKNMLVVLSTTSAIGLDFPKKGKEWFEFAAEGKHILYRSPLLMSSVFAFGPKAENFCGVYDQADIFQRFMWEPPNKGAIPTLMQKIFSK